MVGRRQHKPIPNPYTAFLQKVDTRGFDPAACWVWLGAEKGNGYGNVTVKRRQMSAHRRAFELFCGPVPPGVDVCHTCDNRWCVNPDHLWLGSRRENMADCKTKGRTDGGRRKRLKEAAVQRIRWMLESGVSARRIAETLDVNYSTVMTIKRGESYGGLFEQGDVDRQSHARPGSPGAPERHAALQPEPRHE